MRSSTDSAIRSLVCLRSASNLPLAAGPPTWSMTCFTAVYTAGTSISDSAYNAVSAGASDRCVNGPGLPPRPAMRPCRSPPV